MKSYSADHIKNIAILGHAGSGKTTLAECMLYEAGVVNRRGSVTDKNTISDYHQIEQERGNSLFSSLLHIDWRDYKINIIDTPGYDDFVGEVVSALRVVETGIMLINSLNGVEVGTELLWEYAKKFNTPIIFGINKLDADGANFDKSVEQLQERYGREILVVQYPLNEGSGFNTIIDVLKMTMYKFPADGGKPEKLPIPDSERAKADELHKALIEAIAENDESLMDKYFEKGELDEDEMRATLQKAMINRLLFPVFCLSAKQNMGSGRLMGFIDNVVPSPSEMPPAVTSNGELLPCNPNANLSLFIFKSTSEAYLGDMSFFKVYSGTLKHGVDLVNEQTGVTERISQLYFINGKNREEAEKVVAGDIAATIKLKNTHTNDTLHEKGMHTVISPISFPDPKLRTAIKAKKQGEEDKLGIALNHLHAEDETLRVEHSKELKQIILYAQGEMHLQKARWNLENNYKVEVEFINAKIPFRETIQKSITTMYRHKKQSGGAGQFAEVHLIVEPYYEGMPDPKGISVRAKEEHDLDWGGKFVFLNCIVGGVIDQRFMPAIQKGIMEKLINGPLSGSYVRDVRVSVFDGKMHPVDSNDMAFKLAAMMAFKDAVLQANPKILEPIYNVDILCPEEYIGDLLSDLPTKRGVIMGIESDGHYQKVKVQMPLEELDHYSNSLRQITQGRALYTQEFFDYNSTPANIQEKIVKAYQSLNTDED